MKIYERKRRGEGEEGKGWQHASCQISLPNTANVPFCYLASWKIIELVVFTKEWTKLHVTQVRCLFTSLINLNSALHVRAFYYQCDNSGLSRRNHHASRKAQKDPATNVMNRNNLWNQKILAWNWIGFSTMSDK